MAKPILAKDKRLTFSDYFELNNPVEEIVSELGYLLEVKVLELPKKQISDLNIVQNLKSLYYETIPKISFTSEIAKRDFLRAPLLLEVVRRTNSKMNVEYPLEVNNYLSGSLDYLLRSSNEIVVIEAKKGDIDKGFNQLSAEMIALDQYEDVNRFSSIYGAITIGDMWRFAVLEREAKKILRDVHSFTIPDDIEEIYSIFIGILEQND